MIIQCRRCATRYRFDENLIDGDGIWVRCTRCGNVFFQGPPELSEGETSSGQATPEEAGAAGQNLRTFEDAEQPSPEVDMLRQEPEEERQRLPVSPLSERGILTGRDGGATQNPLGEERASRDDDDDYTPPWKTSGGPRKQRGLFGRLAVFMSVCLVLATALGFVFYQLYPQQGRNLLQNITSQASMIGPLLGLETQNLAIAHSLHFTNLRQRTDHNLILGSIRIVEGTLTNKSRHHLARLQVKGELFDAQGKPLREQVVFCGNILTDDELINLAERDILEILKRPDGNGSVNARVPPGAQVPFMLVFVRENLGETKTQLRLAGYEKLP